jgi:hypothetical protein
LKKGGERTTVFVVETYVVKPDKLGEYAELAKKYVEWTKKRADLFKEVKSWKLFAHLYGGISGGYVEMWEFENLMDYEKAMNRLMQDKEFMTEFYTKVMAMMVPATYSVNVWNPFA